MTAAPSFVKVGATSDGGAIEEAVLAGVQRLEFDLEFQQRKGGGIGGALRNRFQPADPDLYVIAFSGEMPVDYVDPKDQRSIFDGAAENLGDRKGSGVETAVVDIARLAVKNRDITGLAVAAACKDGFGRVAGIVCHVYRVDAGPNGMQRTHLTACRFDVTKPRITSGLFGAAIQVPTTNDWVFRKFAEYGTGQGWLDIAGAARRNMAP